MLTRGEKLERAVRLIVAAALIVAMPGPIPWAATKTVDLDGNGTAESAVDLNVITSYPAKIENKVTNKTAGNKYTFKWYSAGPGGFSSSLAAGTATGVGAKWTWQTGSTIYSYTGSTCAKDVCFTMTAGSGRTPSGPFGVPGRSLTPSDITVSAASLTSSLITFFSPPTVVVSVTSSVGPIGGGLLGYSTAYTNNTTSSVVVDVLPGPAGCCPEIHMLNCDGTCVYYLEDPSNCGACGNACGEGAYCSEGSCVASCGEGLTLCGESCVDTSTDPSNCGGCGNACGEGAYCSEGYCVSACDEGQTLCGESCVFLATDSSNCGGCGIACTEDEFCYSGECIEIPSLTPQASPPPSPSPDEAPLCVTPPSTVTIPPGETVRTCSAQSFLAKEVAASYRACGDGVPAGEAVCSDARPASEGPFVQLVPDPTKVIGDAYLTPLRVQVSDPSGDGLMQPGETVQLKISVLNAGPLAVTGAGAVLSSPPVDLTDDGIADPIPVTILNATSTYPDVQGAPAGGGDCETPPPALTPSVNDLDFTVALPLDHPGDVSRPFVLGFTGYVNGSPFSMNVPIGLGIGSNCDPLAVGDRFDGLEGLLSPMAKLVPEGDAVPFPDDAFKRGSTRPLKLRVKCSGVSLGPDLTAAPEIVSLTEAKAGPIDIKLLYEDRGKDVYDRSLRRASGVSVGPGFGRFAMPGGQHPTIEGNGAKPGNPPNVNAPFFRWSEDGALWIFNMRTSGLAPGTYTLKVRIANTKVYVTGFMIR